MRLSIRFQPWIASLTVALVLLLTASFLLTVFGKFQSVAEVGALQKFGLIVQRTQAQLQAQLGSHRRLVEVLSRSDSSLFERNGVLEPDALVPTLLAALDSSSDLYSVYVGLDSGEFLQAIAVRNQPAVLKALSAPPDTVFALRRIQGSAPQPRVERWRFIGPQGVLLTRASNAPNTTRARAPGTRAPSPAARCTWPRPTVLPPPANSA